MNKEIRLRQFNSLVKRQILRESRRNELKTEAETKRVAVPERWNEEDGGRNEESRRRNEMKTEAGTSN